MHQSTDQDYNLWVLLAQARSAMFRARQQELRQYGITPRQAAVLFIVQAIGHKATPAEISRWLFREAHSVSDLLNRMEKQGLLRKVKDLDRKNMIRIELTDKGREMLDNAMQRESIHRIMSSVSNQEREQLRSILQKIRDESTQVSGMKHKLPFPPTE